MDVFIPPKDLKMSERIFSKMTVGESKIHVILEDEVDQFSKNVGEFFDHLKNIFAKNVFLFMKN